MGSKIEKIYCKDCKYFDDDYYEKCTFREYVETIDSITGIKKTKSVFPDGYIESDFRYRYEFYNHGNDCIHFEKNEKLTKKCGGFGNEDNQN